MNLSGSHHWRKGQQYDDYLIVWFMFGHITSRAQPASSQQTRGGTSFLATATPCCRLSLLFLLLFFLPFLSCSQPAVVLPVRRSTTTISSVLSRRPHQYYNHYWRRGQYLIIMVDHAMILCHEWPASPQGRRTFSGKHLWPPNMMITTSPLFSTLLLFKLQSYICSSAVVVLLSCRSQSYNIIYYI